MIIVQNVLVYFVFLPLSINYSGALTRSGAVQGTAATSAGAGAAPTRGGGAQVGVHVFYSPTGLLVGRPMSCHWPARGLVK